MSTRSFVTVFLLAPVIRHVARIELPSTSAPMIAARFSMDNLFLLTIMPYRSRIVKVEDYRTAERTSILKDEQMPPAGFGPARPVCPLEGRATGFPVRRVYQFRHGGLRPRLPDRYTDSATGAFLLR